MRVSVRYFASIREAIGQGSETLETTATTLGALRTELIAELRSATPQGQNLPTPTQAANAVNFVINAEVAGPKLSLEVAPVLAELANDHTGLRLYDGPYCSTGQRSACVPAATSLTERELLDMCWYVDGVIEKENAADPASKDVPARVPQPAASARRRRGPARAGLPGSCGRC